MSDLPPSPPEHVPDSPPEHLPDSSERSGGVDVEGGEVRAGHDITGRDNAGRDIAERDIVGRDEVTTTNVSGFGARDVTRIVIIVAAIVFVTAACFFSGGIVLGAAVFTALDRPVPASLQTAQSMQVELDHVNNTASGNEVNLSFSEEEINSYFHYIAGPQFGVTEGQARLLSATSQVALAGKWSGLNVPFIAVFNTTPGDQPLQLQSAGVRFLPFGNASFGWLPIPVQILQPLAQQINDSLSKVITFKSITPGTTVIPNIPGAGDWKIVGIKK